MSPTSEPEWSKVEHADATKSPGSESTESALTPIQNGVEALSSGIKSLTSSAESSPDIITIDTPPSNSSLPPREKFELGDFPIDQVRGLRVAVIGAGLHGVSAGVLLPAKVPGIKLTIFEKNPEVGGTWYENTYPGVRCDIPSNVYQSGFAPNTQWSQEYAPGEEILAYWKGVARKYNVYQYLKFQKKIESATWDEAASEWVLRIIDLTDGTNYPSEERFDVVINAIGRFNDFKIPDYPGIETFKGPLCHSSNWDPSLQPEGKRVAVIGNGASGLQVVPSIQPIVQHLDHYARNPTWIAGSFGQDKGRTIEPQYLSKELLKSFEDPDTYIKFRKELEDGFYRLFVQAFRGAAENQNLEEEYTKLMAERVKDKPELLEKLIPSFPPLCRRLTPGPGYLEALTQPNVSYITNPISHFTPTSIVTTDGTERAIDAVICCTGANITMRPPFTITGRAGHVLSAAWSPDPITYLGAATPGFPNLLFLGGPNGHGYAGTVPNQAETMITYIAKILRKVSAQRIRSFEPSQAATDDFMEYADAFFAKTVWTDNCSSWANGGRPGGRVHGHWAGSALHLNFVRKDPRWEDWVWKGESRNRFAWLGSGWTEREKRLDADVTGYIRRPEDIDLRSYHEEWFQ